MQDGAVDYPQSEQVFAATHRVLGGAVVARVLINASWSKDTVTANGVDEAVLSPLPDPCTVYVDDQAHEVTGGSLSFSASSPGVYTVRIDEVEFLPQSWTVTAYE